jgi:hypothetical protein
LRAFYIFEALLMTAIVLAGFWPFYRDLPGGAVPRHPVMYLHGAVFTGWLALLLSQVVLVYRRQVPAHRRLGRVGGAYAVLVLLMGTAVTVIAPVEHVRAGRWTLDYAAGFLVLPIGDLILFGGFFAWGMVTRRVPATHKRLMLLASNALIFPGVARLLEPAIVPMLALWFLPIVLAMAFDRVTIGRVHRVYWVGCAAMAVAFSRVALIESETWLRIGRPIVSAFL